MTDKIKAAWAGFLKSLNSPWNFVFGYPFRMVLSPYVSSDHSNVAKMPWWYGVSYRNSKTAQFICFPAPIHKVISGLLNAYKWWRCRDVNYWEYIEREIRAFVLQEQAIYNAINQAKAKNNRKDLAFWQAKLREHFQAWHGKRDKIILANTTPKPQAEESSNAPEAPKQ